MPNPTYPVPVLIDSYNESQKLYNKANRVQFLAVLRSLACLSLFLGHTYGCIFSTHYHQLQRIVMVFGHDITFLFCPPGSMGVWMLFTLSGYLMGKIFYTHRYTLTVKGITSFCRNRVLRLLPLYYFACAVTLILLYPNLWQQQNWHYLWDILLLRSNNSNLFKVFNPILWSIGTEGHFYIWVPLMFFITMKCVRQYWHAVTAILLLLIASTLYKWYLINQVHVDPYTMLLPNINVFWSGLLIYPLFQQKPLLNPVRLKWHRRISLLLLMLLSMVFSNVVYHNLFTLGFLETAYIFPPITMLLTAYTIYAFEQSEFLYNPPLPFNIQNCLKNPLRLFEVFALLSYGLYIWHGPIILIVYQHMASTNHPVFDLAWLTAISFGITLIISIMTFFIIEKPFLRFRASTRTNTNPINIVREGSFR